jgi:hypothetical protein
MAESATITGERGPLGYQFEFRASNCDVLQGALPQASELYAPIRPLMTAKHYQSFAVASQTHATANLHAPRIFRVNHRAVAPSPPTQCRCTVPACFISLHRNAIIRSDDLCAHSLCGKCATESRKFGEVSIGNDASKFAFRLISGAPAPLRILEVEWEVARG